MRLPRWLTIAMLTVTGITLLAVAGWWWVTWPERTAREFVELLRLQEVMGYIPRVGPEFEVGPDAELVIDFMNWENGWSEVQQQPRSIVDLLSGSGRFKIGRMVPVEFVVVRGLIMAPSGEAYAVDAGNQTLFATRLRLPHRFSRTVPTCIERDASMTSP